LSRAYVDSSWILAIALGEPRAVERRNTLQSFDEVASSELLEAEVRSALTREGEGADHAERHVVAIEWIRPTRRLTPEIDRVLAAGHLRGADLWHLVCALYVSPEPADLAFLTLDREQERVAKILGFPRGFKTRSERR
jgi:PIN domain